MRNFIIIYNGIGRKERNYVLFDSYENDRKENVRMYGHGRVSQPGQYCTLNSSNIVFFFFCFIRLLFPYWRKIDVIFF